MHRMITMHVWLKQTDGRTNIMAITRRFVLTNASRAKSYKSVSYMETNRGLCAKKWKCLIFKLSSEQCRSQRLCSKCPAAPWPGRRLNGCCDDLADPAIRPLHLMLGRPDRRCIFLHLRCCCWRHDQLLTNGPICFLPLDQFWCCGVE